MANTFEKMDDYTLRVKSMLEKNESYGRSLTRLFNFKAQQVTTIFSEWRTYGQGPAVGNQMTVQNFADVQSQQEIRDMHAMLKQMGGTPPALEDDTLKKPRSPALGTANGQ